MAAISPTNAIFGRERERARLREILDAAFSGQGAFLLINGEAGGETYADLALAALRLAAELQLDGSNLDEARAWVGTHDRWLDWSSAVHGLAKAQLFWARLFHPSGTSEKAQHHAAQAFKHASDPRQPLALIASHRLLGVLDTEAGQYDDAAEHLRTSLELAERCEAVYEQALTLLAPAELATAQRASQEATRLLREARSICENLGAQRSLTHADEIAAGLSDREVGVLEQSATGQTNAGIGETLYIYISPRTVAQHLRSIYNKLGVNSRAAAVARWAELSDD